MLKFLTWLSILFGDGRPIVKEQIDYCVLDRSHLTLEQKIEIGIGCSTVNGRNTYSDETLAWWYNDGKPYNTKEKQEKWRNYEFKRKNIKK